MTGRRRWTTTRISRDPRLLHTPLLHTRLLHVTAAAAPCCRRRMMAPRALLLLAACCWLLPGAADAGAEAVADAAADPALVPPHHPGGHLPSASLWTPAQVETWLFAEGFGFLRERFDAAQVNGRVLLAMRDHTLQVDYELEPSACRAGAPPCHTMPRAAAASCVAWIVAVCGGLPPPPPPPRPHIFASPARAHMPRAGRAVTPAPAPIAQRSGTW